MYLDIESFYSKKLQIKKDSSQYIYYLAKKK